MSIAKDYTLELQQDHDGWRWYQMAGPVKCEDEGGPFPSRDEAESDAFEICGDVFAETVAS